MARSLLTAVVLALVASPVAAAQQPGGASAGSTGPTGPASAGAASETLHATGTTGAFVRAPLPARGVTTRSRVNLRARPGDGRVLARLPRGAALGVRCQRVGPRAPGRLGASRVWDRITRASGAGGWVADGYLDTGTDGLVAPLCNLTALTAATVPGAGTGGCALLAPVRILPPFPTPQALIAAALPGARASQAQYGVPIAVTLAQTILETGGGRFTAGANNFFGLKAQSTLEPGRYAFGTRAAGCVYKKTREAERGGLVLTIGAFRAYATLEDSILDHGERLTVNPVYKGAFAYTAAPRSFARVIARRYATDPAYATKLLALMDRYRLEVLT